MRPLIFVFKGENGKIFQIYWTGDFNNRVAQNFSFYRSSKQMVS